MKLPHVNKKALARKRIFVQTPFSHSILNLERKKTCLKSKLSINTSKTHIVEFPCHSSNRFAVTGQEIETIESSKYLGLIIDQTLEFEAHLKGITNAVIAKLSTLRYFSKVFDRKWLIRIYNTYIRPVVQYGVLNYGTTSKTKIMKIEKYQRLIWRTIFNLQRKALVETLRVKDKLFTVREFHIYELCKVLIKALNRKIGGTKQFYMDTFKDEEVRLLQSDKRRIQLKLSKTTKENTKMIGNRVRRFTNKIVNLGIINNFIRLNFVTAKSFLQNFRNNYICGTKGLFCSFWW